LIEKAGSFGVGFFVYKLFFYGFFSANKVTFDDERYIIGK